MEVNILSDARRLQILEGIFTNMVDYWHNNDTNLPLHEFLGISWQEFCDLV